MSDTVLNYKETVKCPHPFNSLYYDMTDKVGPCCLNPLMKAIPVSDYLGSEKLVNIKNSMLQEVKPTGFCTDRCYKYEEMNFGTQRQGAIHEYQDTTIYDTTKIQHIEVRFTSLCNSKCRICNSSISSAIAGEEKAHGLYSGPILSYAGPTEDFVLNEIKQYTDDLQVVTFSGGEPMLQWQHWEFLDHLIENGKSPKLYYYSNGSVVTYKGTHITEKWKHFDRILYRVSLDVSGTAADYWRPGTGSDWNTIVENIRSVRSTLDNVDIQYIITLAWPTLFRIGELLEELEKINVGPYDFAFNAMWEPRFSIQTLPLEYKQKAKEYINSVAILNSNEKYNFHKRNAILSYLDGDDESYRMPAAIQHLKDVDQRRNQSFVDTFPEYAELAREYGY